MAWRDVVLAGEPAKEVLPDVLDSFDGESDLARSDARVNKSGPIFNCARNTGNEASPALRACLSRRPCTISSSSLRVRSSSSLSRLILRLAMRSRKSSTVSEESVGVGVRAAIGSESSDKLVAQVSQLDGVQNVLTGACRSPATTK